MLNNSVLLAKAVQHLYGSGAIKKDKDIADRTGYNKATVSSYISGKIPPSEGFLKTFEKTFRLRLQDFEKGGPLEPIPVIDPLQLISEKLMQLYATSRVNQSLLIEILANQTGKTVMELQRAVSAAMDAELKELLHELRQDARGV
jgi:transcriptional regulator with XRE-family HTH domain